MRVRRKGRLGKAIYYREEYTVRPVTYRDHEDFNVYEDGELIATLDTLGAAIEYIRNETRSR